jgi:hypothetical protein
MVERLHDFRKMQSIITSLISTFASNVPKCGCNFVLILRFMDLCLLKPVLRLACIVSAYSRDVCYIFISL